LTDYATLKKWECLTSDTGENMADPPTFHFGGAREVRKYHIPDFSGWKKICAPASANEHWEQ